jgi:hypothetical protein
MAQGESMFRRLICITLPGILFLSGCTSTTTAEPLPTLENKWTIKLTHSGGIMGLSRSIEVSSSGMYIVTDDRSGETKEGILPAQEVADLKELAASVQYSPVPKETGCADCFIYDIAISGTTKLFTAHVDDVTLEDSGLGPLVLQLRTIMERELN